MVVVVVGNKTMNRIYKVAEKGSSVFLVHERTLAQSCSASHASTEIVGCLKFVDVRSAGGPSANHGGPMLAALALGATAAVFDVCRGSFLRSAYSQV